jgi:hypothetical protein
MEPVILVSSLLLAAAQPGQDATSSQPPAKDAAPAQAQPPSRKPRTTSPPGTTPMPPTPDVDRDIQLPPQQVPDSARPGDSSVKPAPSAPSKPGEPGVRPLSATSSRSG